MNLRKLISTIDDLEQKESTTIVESESVNEPFIEFSNNGIAKELVESFGYTYIYEAEVGQVVNLGGEPYKWMGAQWQNTKTGKVAEKGIKSYLDQLSLAQPVTSTATKTATKSALKTGGKMALKAAPFVGSALSAKEAYDRWQQGDRTGAVISALAGVGWLIPGPAGWVLGGGLDATNVVRDLNKPETAKQGGQPASQRITALQTELKAAGADLGTFGPNGDGIDGKLGDVTRRAAQANPNIAAKYKDVLDVGQGSQPASSTTATQTAAQPEDNRTPLEKYYDAVGTRK
jgi:hypothetical protein